MFLEEIQAILTKEGIYSRITIPKDLTEIPYIEIDLDEDHLGRDQVLKIQSQTQILDPDQKTKFTKIEFSVEYPFTYVPIKSSDLARFIAFINRFSDLPGFELDEVDQTILFRHVYIGIENNVNALFFTSIIGLILMIMDLNAKNIELIASGERSFDSMITEILTELNYL